MFKKINDKAPDVPEVEFPEVVVPTNPVDDDMINEIKDLIEEYIPRFVNLYTDKLKELVKEKNKKIVKNKQKLEEKREKKEDETDEEKKKEVQEKIDKLEKEIKEIIEELEPANLNLETLKELGLDEIKNALTKFIVRNVGSKIESTLPAGETVRAKGMELAGKTIAKLVDEAVSRIDDLISNLMEKILKEEKDAAEAGLEEAEKITGRPVEEIVEEVVEEPVEEIIEEVIEEIVEEPVETIKREVIEEPEEVIEEVIEEVVEEVYGEPVEVETKEVVEEVISAHIKEVVEEKEFDLVKIKEDLVNHVLEKHRHRIIEKFLNDQEAQNKAIELFKQRIESIVDNTIAKKKATN